MDCRSRGAGGYSQRKIGSRFFGVYTLRGGSQRYDGTRTRVERSFREIKNTRNSSITFNANFMITDLGDRPTNITQLHAGSSNKILFGSRAGQMATSAVLALSASKTAKSNRFKFSVSQTIVPYTTKQSGKRTNTFFRNITKGVLYRLTVTTGFNAKRRAYTHYSVTRVNNPKDKKSRTINHTFTTGELSLRYGAYETADSGDVGAEIRFANTQICRFN